MFTDISFFSLNGAGRPRVFNKKLSKPKNLFFFESVGQLSGARRRAKSFWFSLPAGAKALFPTMGF